MITLDDAKTFLRVDGTDDDALIQSLIDASVEYLANATGSNVDMSSKVYDLAQKILVVHWYENREPVGQANVLAYSLESMIMQLRYTAPDPVDGGST
ncbi:head-tail connector protein [Alicyclobacillus shizuokensis]|uniref:head-tail connector protein n=1 Tax=Alicyclobacillus shizuokensis TaxID=392014 RepID=UPI000835E4A2|nr:head-tail connector protein [Alicyclobacillus shizuokensis]